MGDGEREITPETIGDVVVEEVAAATTEVARGAAYLARLLGWDESLLLGMRRFHGPWQTRAARAFTRAGDATTWASVGICVLGAGLATRSRKTIHLGMRLGVAATLAAAAAQALKRSLTRKRPTHAIAGFTALAENPDAFSFPSGHTAAAFAVAVALQGETAASGPLSIVLAVGIGLSRVYLGAHYPLDVGAGAVLGAGAGAATRLLVP
jgi:undecaprenyl-diphosphatase